VLAWSRFRVEIFLGSTDEDRDLRDVIMGIMGEEESSMEEGLS
jgi:hypothetical protein